MDHEPRLLPTRDQMLWLAVHLPALPLEVFERALAEPLPLAVDAGARGGRERILLANSAALDAGVRPGLGIAAARSLCPTLRLLLRRPADEQSSLRHLAIWCLGFTPQVSLAPPTGVLLEVTASLRLFGGAESLMTRVSSGLTGLGYRHRLVMAPTPQGAMLLAIWGEGRPALVVDRQALRAALAHLPLSALGLTPRELEDLSRCGLGQLSDLLHLPRTGLTERLGRATLTSLERLLGETPDPRLWIQPPAHYRGHLELPAEVERVEGLIFPCRRLLDELEGVLCGHQGGTDRLEWRLQHDGVDETRVILGAARPLRESTHWLDLLRERLRGLALPAPVRAIRLLVSQVQPLIQTSGALFPELTPESQGLDVAWLDRLRARLGPMAVRGLALVADHRPEYAWRWCDPGEQGLGLPRADRPLWLLSQPRPLPVRDGRPWCDGPLDLGQERERIDIGWWDDREVKRDYFVATTRRGERLWIYRELEGERGWFLHGLF
jgi:protein ImuB